MKLLIAALLLGALQDEKVELKWKFEKGQVLRYRMTQTTTTDMGMMTIEQSMRTTYFYTVADVDADGAATLTVKYEAMAMKASGPMEYDYDSERDKESPDNPIAQILSRMVGQSFSLKLSPTGKVSDVKGFDKIVESLFKGADDDPQAAAMRQMFKQSYSDEAVQSMFQQMYVPLPGAPVGKGDTWKSEMTAQVPILGKAKLLGSSKLADLQGRDAHVEQEWTMEVKGGDDQQDNPLAGMIKVTSAKGKTKAVFSLERGVFLSVKSDSTTIMAAAGQEMEIRGVNETRFLEGKAGPK